MSNRSLLDLLRGRGFDVSSASSSIATIYADDLLREFGVAGGAGTEDGRSGEEGEETPEPGSDSLAEEEGQPSGTEGVPVPSPLPVAAGPAGTPPADRPNFTVARREVAQERPRVLPMERIQSAVRAQHSRLSGEGKRQDFFRAPASERGRPGGGFFSGSRQGLPWGPARDGQRPGPWERPAAAGPRQPSGFSQRGGFTAPRPQVPPSPLRPAPIPAPRPRVPAEEGAGQRPAAGATLCLKFPLSVREFAPAIGLKPFQLIAELMQMGIFASMNYLLEEALARKIAERFGHAVESAPPPAVKATVVRPPRAKALAPDAVLEPRPPVVCVLGHVDHGKTTLLDAIRKTNVVAGEAGGITQHIGAYAVAVGDRSITFIDTPGHAAFSKMRERGANATDVAVLVVAADDGFMPQSDEALKFAQRAGVPVVVAINKADAPGAGVDRVKQQMQQRGIVPEEWGGETLCGAVSALKGDGIDGLLELILVQAEVLALRADFHAPVQGVVVESQMEIGRGPTAAVIVQEGTLRVGNALVCGGEYCKVRALLDDRGRALAAATPSQPVKVMGWSGPVEVGATFSQAKDEKEARLEAEKNRLAEGRDGAAADGPAGAVSRGPADREEGLEALYAAIHAKQKKVLRVLVKADVQGSVEALVACLEALPQDRIGLDVVRAEVGPVSIGDVEFAQPAGATVVAFHTRLENGVQALLKRHAISLIQHSVIYELVDRVREAMADLLEPELREEKLGGAQVRQVFTLSRGIIAGCMVVEGKIARDALFRIRRDGKQLFEGKIASLRRGKEDVAEVRAGYECGIAVAGFQEHAAGDSIECFRIQKIRPSL